MWVLVLEDVGDAPEDDLVHTAGIGLDSVIIGGLAPRVGSFHILGRGEVAAVRVAVVGAVVGPDESLDGIAGLKQQVGGRR